MKIVVTKVNTETINIIHRFSIWLYSITCSVKFLPQAESVADKYKNYQVKEQNFQIHLTQNKNYSSFSYKTFCENENLKKKKKGKHS